MKPYFLGIAAGLIIGALVISLAPLPRAITWIVILAAFAVVLSLFLKGE